MKFDPNDLITFVTAANLMDVERQRISALVKNGQLKAVWIDGVPFVKRKDVETFERKPAGRPKGSKNKKSIEKP
jgi:hypothetical protein